MNTVTLQVETELDPTAAPRVFGYLGGLGHIPLQAALRRSNEGEASSGKIILEVQFESPLSAAQRICAKVEQMPFVLNSRLAGNELPPLSVPPGGGTGSGPDVSAMRFAAARRGYAISHRAQLRYNA